MNIIEVKNVHKCYGNIIALDDISFNVKQGCIFGLLGQNGAGKTTFIKALLNLVNISSGEILLEGHSYQSRQTRAKVALLPERFSFFPYYTIESTLYFYGKMRLLDKVSLEKQVSYALNRLDIAQIKNRKLGTLSKGQLQRTGIAALLLGNISCYLLDEPFSGLDPIGIKDIKQIILELKEQGKTIFINSHILSEVEQICDEIAIIHNGKCLATGEINQLKKNSSLEDFFCKTVRG